MKQIDVHAGVDDLVQFLLFSNSLVCAKPGVANGACFAPAEKGGGC